MTWVGSVSKAESAEGDSKEGTRLKGLRHEAGSTNLLAGGWGVGVSCMHLDNGMSGRGKGNGSVK